MHFKTRTHAGQLLAAAVTKIIATKYQGMDAVIYALPRGGVPLSFQIASALNMPVDLIIPRKIGHPSNPEYALGAVTETGEIICNEETIANLDPIWLEQQKEAGVIEAKRRRACYLEDRAPCPVTGKLAILVDDGIATGLTMRAAIHDIKKRHPDKIIVAIPVMPKETAKILAAEVDELAALLIDPNYQGSVGSYYQYFHQLCDDEVIRLINQLDADNRPKSS
jgi:putative phosphoribosyl transferase